MSYLTILTNTPTPQTSFCDVLSNACNQAFPDLTVPGSWYGIMEFRDAFIAANNPSYQKTLCPTIPESCSPKKQNKKRTSYSPKKPNSYNKKRTHYSPKKPNSWNKNSSRKPKSERVYLRNDVPNISLIIKNLPVKPNINSLTEIFEAYGEVDHIRLIKGSDGSCGGIGFVTFKTMEGSACAYAPLHKISYQNGIIYTEYARNR